MYVDIPLRLLKLRKNQKFDHIFSLMSNMNSQQKQKAIDQHIEEQKSFKTASARPNENKRTLLDFANPIRKIQSFFSANPLLIYGNHDENDATPLLLKT